MNKRRLAILILSFFGLIIGSTVLYKVLASQYQEEQQEDLIVETPISEELADNSNSDFISPITTITAAPTITVTIAPTSKPTEPLTEPTKTTDTALKTDEVQPTKAPKSPVNKEVEATSTPINTIAPVATKAPTLIPDPTKVPISANAATNFMVEDYSGNRVNLSDFFGKPIVMNFWASWCGPCKEEMPIFNKVSQEMKGEVTFLMIDLVDGRRETKQSGYNYISSEGFTFPVYYDTNQDAAYAYSVTSIPTTYFIHADGSIATFHKGTMNESSLRNEISKIVP